MEAPWEKPLKPRHRQQEERISKSGGQTHPASGRIWRFKRDGILFDFLIEARHTDSGSYRVKLDELHQITREANMTPPGCNPAMQIEFGHEEWILIPLATFREIYNELVNQREGREE